MSGQEIASSLPDLPDWSSLDDIPGHRVEYDVREQALALAIYRAAHRSFVDLTSAAPDREEPDHTTQQLLELENN